MADESPRTDGSAAPTSEGTHSLPPWNHGDLPQPPAGGWRLWVGLLGPGVVLAGTSIGSGEWLSGPAVTAQYGGTLLWLATISIVLQVFCNLTVMRYALYCGEPILVGAMRTKPGPRFWVICILLFDFAAIWPFNASNAAVPLAAAFLGRLPAAGDAGLVKFLGFAIFIAAIVPLIFGGTVYRMLEKIMSFKLIFVLVYLTVIAAFMVSWPVAKEVATGFVSPGIVPIRADTIVSGPHFNWVERDGDAVYRVRGTVEDGAVMVAEFSETRGSTAQIFKLGQAVPAELKELAAKRDAMVAQAQAVAQPSTFFVRTRGVGGTGDTGAPGTAQAPTLTAAGIIGEDRLWHAKRLTVTDERGEHVYTDLAAVPAPHGERLRELITNQGVEKVNLAGYVTEHGKLPPLDWAMLAVFCAFAGAGGLTNALLSNYARDKGWGMGGHVGAIPSALGGRTITLSHSGTSFPTTPQNMSRWRGWLRHIFRDQVAIWMVASLVGMALPCMLSLEFIRNATVDGNRVAAL